MDATATSRHHRRPEVLFQSNYPVPPPVSSAQPHAIEARPTWRMREFPAKMRQPRPGEENAVLAAFIAWVNALGLLSHASPALKARMLMEVKLVARHIDVSGEAGAVSGYDRI